MTITMEFNYAVPAYAPASAATEKDKLRNLSLDNLARELDDLSTRASRAASTLRTLRPMLTAAKR